MGGDTTVFSLIVIIVGLAALACALWFYHHGEISAVVMEAAHWQMQLIRHFTDRFDIADAQVLATNPNRVTFDQLVRLLRNIGGFFLYPAMGLSVCLASLCLRCAASTRFTRSFNLEKLMAEQAKSYRSIAAFVGRRLALTPVRKGEPRPGDAALQAREWIEAWAAGENGEFDEKGARRELARQLGDVWRGLENAAPHVRCMLAVMALHRAQKRNEAIELLGDLADSLPKGRGEGRAGPEAPLLFPKRVAAMADRVLEDAEIAQPALKTMSQHFFTTPGVMSALGEARLFGGVLAPAQFAFLKLVDRRLWYALHSLGFEVEGPKAHPHPSQRVEAIGARDHWAAEHLAGRPIVVPTIDRAIAAIRAAGGVAPHAW